MKTKIQIIKFIKNARTYEAVLSALKNVDKDYAPSQLLTGEIEEEKQKKKLKSVFAIMAIIFILFVLCLSFIGGKFISEYVGPISIVFGVLDITIVYLLFGDHLKGDVKKVAARKIAIGFEVISLLYLGYAMGGYFGSGNVRTAADNKVVKANAILKDHYEAAKSIEDLFTQAVNNAKSIARQEKQTGEGVVFVSASRITPIGLNPPPEPPTLEEAPEFKNLAQANKWLKNQREIISNITKAYDIRMKIVKNKAKSTAESLRNTSGLIALEPEQVAGMESLITPMEGISSQADIDSKIPDDLLTPDDLKADSFQGFIGYIIDGVIIFFILMIAFQKSSDKKLEEIKDEEIRSLIEDICLEYGITPNLHDMEGMPLDKAVDVLKIIESNKSLIPFLKDKATLGEFVIFAKDYSQLAKQLGNSQWSLAEIREEITKDPKFLSIATDAIKIKQGDWKIAKSIMSNPEELFKVDKDMQIKLIQILKQIESRAILKGQDFKDFVERFVCQKNLSADYINTLESCVNNIKSGSMLLRLDPGFIEKANPVVAAYICKTVTNEKQFPLITTGWTNRLDESFREILKNGIVNEPKFEDFTHIVFNQGGIEGVKEMVAGYAEKKMKAETGSTGHMSVKLDVDLKELMKPFETETANMPDFLQRVRKSFRNEVNLLN